MSSQGVQLILVEEIIQSEFYGKLRSEIMSDLFTGWFKGHVKEVKVINNIEFYNSRDSNLSG